jgi:hypothetical protein
MTVEYLSWSPDRDTFVSTMTALTNPVTNKPLASIDGGKLVPSQYVCIDEIGPVVKEPGEYDEDGTEITPPVLVEGHHVNLLAYGALAELLEAGGGWEGIFPLLGTMEQVQSEDGVPPAWAGTSGMRIYPAEAVNHRMRVWA